MVRSCGVLASIGSGSAFVISSIFTGGCESHIVGDVGVDVQRSGSQHMTRHGEERFYIHAVLQRQRCEGMPLRYNYDNPENPRTYIRDFRLSGKVFHPFPNRKIRAAK